MDIVYVSLDVIKLIINFVGKIYIIYALCGSVAVILITYYFCIEKCMVFIFFIILLLLNFVYVLNFLLKKNYINASYIFVLKNKEGTSSEKQHIVKEINRLKFLVKQDFLLDWYLTISNHDEFKSFTEKILESVTQQLIQRASYIDLAALINEAVKDCVTYLDVYTKGQIPNKLDKLDDYEFDRLLLEELKSCFEDLTLSNINGDIGIDLRSSLADNIRACLKCLLDRNHYNFLIGRELIVEILVKNVFIPLIKLISDPLVLFPLLINILVDLDANAYCKRLKLIATEDVIIESVVNTLKSDSTNTRLSISKSFEAEDLKKNFNSRSMSTSSSNSLLDSINYENCVSSNLIKDVFICDTEETRDKAGTTYTLYVVKYRAWHDNSVTQQLELREHCVRRRYREFVLLQQRLESVHYYHDSLQGLEVPGHRFELPFGTMNRGRVASRRRFLEKYLQGLISRAELCMAAEVKEFLAYERDPTLAFAVHASNSTSSQAFIMRTVNGVLDALSGGFLDHSLPTTSLPSVPLSSSSSLEKQSFIVNHKVHLPRVFTTNTGTKKEFHIAMEEAAMQRNMRPSLDWSMQNFSYKQCQRNCIRYTPISGELSAGILRVIALANIRRDGLLQACSLGLFHDVGGVLFDAWLCSKIRLLSSPSQVRDFLRLTRLALWPDFVTPQPDLPLSLLAKALEEALVEFFPRWLVILLNEDRLRRTFMLAINALSRKKLNQAIVLRFFLRLFAELFPELKS